MQSFYLEREGLPGKNAILLLREGGLTRQMGNPCAYGGGPTRQMCNPFT